MVCIFSLAGRGLQPPVTLSRISGLENEWMDGLLLAFQSETIPIESWSTHTNIKVTECHKKEYNISTYRLSAAKCMLLLLQWVKPPSWFYTISLFVIKQGGMLGTGYEVFCLFYVCEFLQTSLTLPCKKFVVARFIPSTSHGLHQGWNTDHK